LPADQQDQGWPEHGLVPKQVLNRTSWGAGATVIFARKQMQTHLTRASAAAAAAAAALDSSNSVSSSTMSTNLPPPPPPPLQTMCNSDCDCDGPRFIARIEAFAQRQLDDVEQAGVRLSGSTDCCAALYNEAHRAYHTLTHIDSMLTLDGRGRIVESDAIELATWFHDAVYDPTRSDNEERSAEMFDEFAQRRFSLSDALTTRVRRFMSSPLTKHRLDGDLADRRRRAAVPRSRLVHFGGIRMAEYDAYARGIRHRVRARAARAAYLQWSAASAAIADEQGMCLCQRLVSHRRATSSAAKANVEREKWRALEARRIFMKPDRLYKFVNCRFEMNQSMRFCWIDRRWRGRWWLATMSLLLVVSTLSDSHPQRTPYDPPQVESFAS
jgi:predicted metal-dependent HD superfamily phosphohydrolase